LSSKRFLSVLSGASDGQAQSKDSPKQITPGASVSKKRRIRTEQVIASLPGNNSELINKTNSELTGRGVLAFHRN
jgi:hypothetical protein